MTTERVSDVSVEDVEAARLLLARLGVSPEDLLGERVARVAAPTFGEYVPKVWEALGSGINGGGRVYRSAFNRILEHWSDRSLDEPKTSELAVMVDLARTQAQLRGHRNGRDGQGAAEHMFDALRCIYRHAVNDELIDASRNPAARLVRPRRLPSTRRALPEERLEEVIVVASSTGDDPVLDSLLIRLHIETACRRCGALNLRLGDLDQEQSLIKLREKGGTVRWQPISPTLMTHLLAHAQARGVIEDDEQLLRFKTGTPLTRKRYDTLWGRIRRQLHWADRQGISAHWLRHTTLTWVERNFGHAVARAFAGHTDNHNSGSTHTYVRASINEVANAVAALTGEPHPLGILGRL